MDFENSWVTPIDRPTVWVRDEKWPEGHEVLIVTGGVNSGDDEQMTELTWVAEMEQDEVNPDKRELKARWLMARTVNAVVAVMIREVRGHKFTDSSTGKPIWFDASNHIQRMNQVRRLPPFVVSFLDNKIKELDPNHMSEDSDKPAENASEEDSNLRSIKTSRSKK